jgi:hypothetical protein
MKPPENLFSVPDANDPEYLHRILYVIDDPIFSDTQTISVL